MIKKENEDIISVDEEDFPESQNIDTETEVLSGPFVYLKPLTINDHLKNQIHSLKNTANVNTCNDTSETSEASFNDSTGEVLGIPNNNAVISSSTSLNKASNNKLQERNANKPINLSDIMDIRITRNVNTKSATLSRVPLSFNENALLRVTNDLPTSSNEKDHRIANYQSVFKRKKNLWDMPGGDSKCDDLFIIRSKDNVFHSATLGESDLHNNTTTSDALKSNPVVQYSNLTRTVTNNYAHSNNSEIRTDVNAKQIPTTANSHSLETTRMLTSGSLLEILDNSALSNINLNTDNVNLKSPKQTINTSCLGN